MPPDAHHKGRHQVRLADSIRDLLRERGKATRADMMQATGCTDNQAGNVIWHLRRRGEIFVLEKRSRYGFGPQNIYALKPEHERKSFTDSGLQAVSWL